MTGRTSALIDLEALRRNLAHARRLAGGARIMAVIKCDAYGHGAPDVAMFLDDDVDGFGVESVDAGVTLRDAGVRSRIVIMSSFHHRTECDELYGTGLEPVLHCPEQLELLQQAPKRPPSVWLKIDSGMHRLGFPPGEARDALDALQKMQGIESIRMMSHLANADDPSDPYTIAQTRAFDDFTSALPFERSLANSAGLLFHPATRLDWVRPGLMLYGASPAATQTGPELGLEPVMTVQSFLLAVRELERGAPIGYGGDWRCPERMRVGVVACGYGDGYPRHALSGTPVLVRGRPAPLVGRVSMDLLSVDLRSHADVAVGDRVILWGAGLPAETVAHHAGTIPYELMTSVTLRVPRIPVRGGGG